MRLSEGIVLMQRVYTDHGDLQIASIDMLDGSAHPVEKVAVHTANSRTHWEDRDDPALGPKFLVLE